MVQYDHVKYPYFLKQQRFIDTTVAQAKIKRSASSPEKKLMFAKQISQRLREVGMLLSF
ncbi:MAG: hypothetical protein ACJAZT_000852, partial [Gammaproteobacteria bacterium]